jgi:hypothetical protein
VTAFAAGPVAAGGTIRSLVDGGFEADAVIDAVVSTGVRT